jgi:transmembrane sensor
MGVIYMDHNRKKYLHRRYLTRELSKVELKEFFKMLEHSNPQDLADFDDIANEFPSDFEPAEDIAQKILSKQQAGKSSRLVLRVAAAAIIGFVILFCGSKIYQEYTFIQKTKTFDIVRVPLGKIKKVKLEDGTLITLTSGAVFKYPQAFTKTERRVYLLEGQAFFEVAHDKTKPFRVNSGKLSTTALGTSFIIKHYKNYGYEKVSLYTGKVQIDRNGVTAPPVILHPGQEFDYHNGTLSTVTGFDNSEDAVKAGALDFKRVPFRDAIYSMASYYNVNIQFNEDDFKKYSISGNFNSGSVDALLGSLTFIYPFKVNKINSSTYKLTLSKKQKHKGLK